VSRVFLSIQWSCCTQLTGQRINGEIRGNSSFYTGCKYPQTDGLCLVGKLELQAVPTPLNADAGLGCGDTHLHYISVHQFILSIQSTLIPYLWHIVLKMMLVPSLHSLERCSPKPVTEICTISESAEIYVAHGLFSPRRKFYSGTWPPYSTSERKWHRFNRALDHRPFGAVEARNHGGRSFYQWPFSVTIGSWAKHSNHHPSNPLSHLSCITLWLPLFGEEVSSRDIPEPYHGFLMKCSLQHCAQTVLFAAHIVIITVGGFWRFIMNIVWMFKGHICA